MGDNSIRDAEWENRILCSDETCIGVIGRDGCCKECGRPYEGELPENFGPSPDDSQDGQPPCPAPDDQPVHQDIVQEQNQSADPDDEWAQRKLCRDEACIGVIGSDGRCRECGLPLEEEE